MGPAEWPGPAALKCVFLRRYGVSEDVVRACLYFGSEAAGPGNSRSYPGTEIGR